MAAKKKYRVGMIGCGRKGTQHARAYALNPLSEVVAIADTDPENLELFKQRFHLKTGYSDYKEMLAKENLDIVAPILPVGPNPEVVIGCAQSGKVKAIFCEKPMSVSLEQADRMVAECRSRGIKFAAGDAYRSFQQLWDARGMIDAGELGEITSINLYQGSPQISGGGCQGISVVRMFANDAEIDWISGWCAGDPWSAGDQNMGGHIRFKSGLDAFIHNKRTSRNGIEVIGEKGFFYSDFTSFRLFKHKGEEGSRLFSDVVEAPGLFPDALHWGPGLDADGWISMSTRQAHSIQSMIDALEHDTEPRCSGDDMRKALEIAIAFRESHRRGHAAVKLPIEDRSQKIVPLDRRLKNKKETMGEEAYREAISRHTKARTSAD